MIRTVRASVGRIIAIGDYYEVSSVDVVLSSINKTRIKRITSVTNAYTVGVAADQIATTQSQISLPDRAVSPDKITYGMGTGDGSIQLPNGNQIECDIEVQVGMVIGCNTQVILTAAAIAPFEFISTIIFDIEDME